MTQSYIELEKLVQRIQQQLAPEAIVKHNVKLPGIDSEIDRQVDVLVEQKVGQYDIKIVIDCKDYKHRADVKKVEEFYGLLTDVRAHKGVLVCPRGFTTTAKIRAKKLKIDLYSPFDTQPHKWQVNPIVPAACDFKKAAVSFGISSSAPVPFILQNKFYEQSTIFNAERKPIGTPLEIMSKRSNAGEYPMADGAHERIPLCTEAVTLIDNGYGMLSEVQLYINLMIESELYIGQFPITNVSGFKDEIEGHVITNAFEVGILNPNEVLQTWKKVENISEAEVKPVFIMKGIVCWPEQ